jgi:hypothetical protein
MAGYDMASAPPRAARVVRLLVGRFATRPRPRWRWPVARSRPRCSGNDHRVVYIRFPRRDAQAVRDHIVNALGEERVSPLRRTWRGWQVVICRDCARRSAGTVKLTG